MPCRVGKTSNFYIDNVLTLFIFTANCLSHRAASLTDFGHSRTLWELSGLVPWIQPSFIATFFTSIFLFITSNTMYFFIFIFILIFVNFFPYIPIKFQNFQHVRLWNGQRKWSTYTHMIRKSFSTLFCIRFLRVDNFTIVFLSLASVGKTVCSFQVQILIHANI